MSDEKKAPAEPRVEQPPEAQPYVVKNEMHKTEQVAPDGHVNLTKEDIKARA